MSLYGFRNLRQNRIPAAPPPPPVSLIYIVVRWVLDIHQVKPTLDTWVLISTSKLQVIKAHINKSSKKVIILILVLVQALEIRFITLADCFLDSRSVFAQSGEVSRSQKRFALDWDSNPRPPNPQPCALFLLKYGCDCDIISLLKRHFGWTQIC